MYDHSYYLRDIPENWFAREAMLRPDQLAALCYTLGWPFWGEDAAPRDPGLIVSYGCGTGMLEGTLELMGFEVIGVDPNVPVGLYRGFHLERSGSWEAGTMIFCESIEHIEVLPALTAERVVITNWPDRHPIAPDPSGWDHVRRVDDAFFDEISQGWEVVLRRGSHLVLDAKGR